MRGGGGQLFMDFQFFREFLEPDLHKKGVPALLLYVLT